MRTNLLKLGRQVPSEYLGIAVDGVLGGLTGEDDTIGATDNSYSPDAVIAEIREKMLKNTKASNAVRNNATELERENTILNNRLRGTNKRRNFNYRSPER